MKDYIFFTSGEQEVKFLEVNGVKTCVVPIFYCFNILVGWSFVADAWLGFDAVFSLFFFSNF